MTNPANYEVTSHLVEKSHNGDRLSAMTMTRPMVSIECGKLSRQLASLPCLEQVSRCSDDSDSLSSLSSDGSSCSDCNDSPSASSMNQRRRSMFKSFWEKNGGSPLQLREKSSTAASYGDVQGRKAYDDQSQGSCSSNNSQDTASNDPDNSYERTLKAKEGIERLPASIGNSRRRRQIFGNACPLLLSKASDGPLPGLCFDYDNNVRLVKSSPELGRTPGPSCLQRSCRYSGNQRRNYGRSSSCSVSFDPKVSVLRYRETKEQWAASGWSKYFAG